jgi:adenylate cyclase
MQSDSLTRKLVAIFYADVVGYSRLIGNDEEGTHRRVMTLLDLVTQSISDAGGSVLNFAGDAILAEFSSVITAVKTAAEIQVILAGQNRAEPEDSRIEIRIGIHLGDVIQDRGEVFGDGVNLAARLEAAAPPGGICISSVVHDQVSGKIDIEFTDDGKEEFKNIARPVYVFRWAPGSQGSLPGRTVASMKKAAEKPSIAVLALANLNHDPELDFIGDGITEDLITALSKIRTFKVISRESTFSYKGSAIDVRKVAAELGVRYVLEGSVRKAGSRVRVTAQLIDADTGHHVWAERYDREMEDIFDLQDEMVQLIAGALEPELNAFERELAVRKPPGNLDAWEQYQRGLWHMWIYDNENVTIAMDLLRKSIEADSSFAPAHAYFAYCCYITVVLGYAGDPETRLAEGMTAARMALKCDDKDAISHFAIGRILMMQGKHDAAINSLQRSIELNPCFAHAYHGLGFALGLAGELEKSKKTTEIAINISPRDPMLFAFYSVHCLTCVLDGENEEGLEWAQRAVQSPNNAGYWGHAVMAAASANLGRVDEAREALANALREKPNLSIAYLQSALPTKHEGTLEPYLDGLRKAGLG